MAHGFMAMALCGAMAMAFACFVVSARELANARDQQKNVMCNKEHTTYKHINYSVT